MALDIEKHANVAVELPVDGTFCYRIPSELQNRVGPGALVWVPFRNRRVLGLVLDVLNRPCGSQAIKDVIQVLEDRPLYQIGDVKWLQWAARYYLHPLGKVLKAALPPRFQVRPSLNLHLTENGQKAAEHDEVLRELSASSQQKAISKTSLARRYGKERAEQLISRWTDLGLVEANEHPACIPSGRPKRRVVSLTPQGRRYLQPDHPQTKRLGKKQHMALQLLASNGEMPVVTIERTIPGVRSSLTSLENRGLVTSRLQGAPLRALEFERDPDTSPYALTSHQKEALAKIEKGISDDAFRGFLLWGVTGSGKTEIYLRSAELCLRRNKQVLVLVPEISLTHQLVREFVTRFGDRIGIIHSRLPRGERLEIWRAIHQSKLSIILGARSALFAPCAELGLIIVDEEHDESYKQEEGFRYHARNLALMRGKLRGCVVLLGSATPSLESYQNSHLGKLTRLELPERIEGRTLPQVRVVDLRHRGESRGRHRIFSSVLKEAMEDTLARNEQILLFLNRRGYATFMQCTECGSVMQCRNCAVSLVYHRSNGELRCHYCGWHRLAGATCPECRGMGVRDLGIGTETLEEAVRDQFPSAKVLRMDRDTTGPKDAQRDILRIWRKGDADILIGTQMVAKGHHVPNVTLVGVVLADVSLNLPDFRASERTFQLLLQVGGRAGRGDRPGLVVIQTYNPHHPSIQYSVSQDYGSFALQELRVREAAGYPPFQHLVAFRISGTSEGDTAKAAQMVGDSARGISKTRGGLRCLGPSPAPLARLKGRYRWNLLLKGDLRAELHSAARHLVEAARAAVGSGRVRLTVDVDPQWFL